MVKLLVFFILNVCFGLAICRIAYKKPASAINNITLIADIVFWSFLTSDTGVRIVEYFQGASFYTIGLHVAVAGFELFAACIQVAMWLIEKRIKKRK